MKNKIRRFIKNLIPMLFLCTIYILAIQTEYSKEKKEIVVLSSDCLELLSKERWIVVFNRRDARLYQELLKNKKVNINIGYYSVNTIEDGIFPYFLNIKSRYDHCLFIDGKYQVIRINMNKEDFRDSLEFSALDYYLSALADRTVLYSIKKIFQ